jgi:hypothetical protein
MFSNFVLSPGFIFTVLPAVLMWFAGFLFLARKKILDGVVFGIAVAGFLITSAVDAFITGHSGSAAVWALLAIAVLVGMTLMIVGSTPPATTLEGDQH